MRDKLGFLLAGCFFIVIGVYVIDAGTLGGGIKAPLVYIGANKYWVGGVLIGFGLWIVISALFTGKPK